jgi:hypothetical protein
MSKTSGVPAQGTSIEKFHHETSDWRRQNALWVDEVAVWHQDHEKALAALAKVEQVLHRFADAAARQRDALAAEQQRLADHEHALAAYLQGDESQTLQALEKQHQAARIQQAERETQQQETKRLFREMMTKIDAIERAIKG